MDNILKTGFSIFPTFAVQLKDHGEQSAHT